MKNNYEYNYSVSVFCYTCMYILHVCLKFSKKKLIGKKTETVITQEINILIIIKPGSVVNVVFVVGVKQTVSCF